MGQDKLHFQNFKIGDRLAFLVSPIEEEAEEDKMKRAAKEGNEYKPGEKKYLPHSHTHEKLKEMFGQLQSALGRHGFQFQIFGPPEAMHRSLTKHLGSVWLPFDKDMDTGLYVIQTVTGETYLDVYFGDGSWQGDDLKSEPEYVIPVSFPPPPKQGKL